jgi:hypothetical protein
MMLIFEIVKFFSITRKFQHIVKISKNFSKKNSYMVCNQIWLNLLVDDQYLLHKSGEQITLILIQHIPTTKVQHVLAELIIIFKKN